MNSPALPWSDDAWPLDRVQRWLLTVISQAGQRSEAVQREMQELISPSSRQTAAGRLEIYAQAYFARLLECLRHEFTLTRLAMGDELFDGFAAGCLQVYPPRSYTLARLGESFPRYLRESRPGDIAAPAWPDFLIELAELERAQSEVFDGPGAERLPPQSDAALGDISPEAWAASRLELNPSLRLLAQSFPLAGWCAAARGAETPPAIPQPQPNWLALVRRDYVVQRWQLTEPQYVLLQSLLAGQTIGKALQAASATGQTSPEDIRQWFFDWTGRQIILGRAVATTVSGRD